MQIEPGYSYDVMKCFLNTLASNLGQNSFIQIKCRSSWADYKHFKSNSTFFSTFSKADRHDTFNKWPSYHSNQAQIELKGGSKKNSKASKGAEKELKRVEKSPKRVQEGAEDDL